MWMNQKHDTECKKKPYKFKNHQTNQIIIRITIWSIWRGKWQPTPVFLPGESLGKEAGMVQSMGVTKIQTQLK